MNTAGTLVRRLLESREASEPSSLLEPVWTGSGSTADEEVPWKEHQPWVLVVSSSYFSQLSILRLSTRYNSLQAFLTRYFSTLFSMPSRLCWINLELSLQKFIHPFQTGILGAFLGLKHRVNMLDAYAIYVIAED